MTKKKDTTDENISFQVYTIGIMFLDTPILFNKDFLKVNTADLSASQLRIYPILKTKIERTAKGKEFEKQYYTPMIFLNLIYNGERAFLNECLLPNQQILIAKTELVESESEKYEYNGEMLFTKATFNLTVLTRKNLTKTTQTYEEYQKDISELKIAHKIDLENQKQTYIERNKRDLSSYKKDNEVLENQIEELKKKITILTSKIPSQMNDVLATFINNQHNIKNFLDTKSTEEN